MTIDLRNLFEDLDGLDKKFVDALVKALKNSHIKDFDYIKFKQSVNTMIDMNIEKETAFKSAFATASTLGFTKDKLIKTANHYKNVLGKERSQFGEALKRQQKEKIAGKAEEAEKLKEKIENYHAKIAQMEKEIAVFQKKIDNTDSEVKKAEKKLIDTRDKFLAALEVFTNQIDDDLDLINQYL